MLKKLLEIEIIRFILVGLFNTFMGVVTMFAFYHWLHLGIGELVDYLILCVASSLFFSTGLLLSEATPIGFKLLVNLLLILPSVTLRLIWSPSRQ